MKKETPYERLQKYGRMWNENGIKQTAYKDGVKETEARLKIEFIIKLLNKETMSILQIAEIVGVEETYVLEIKNVITQN